MVVDLSTSSTGDRGLLNMYQRVKALAAAVPAGRLDLLLVPLALLARLGVAQGEHHVRDVRELVEGEGADGVRCPEQPAGLVQRLPVGLRRIAAEGGAGLGDEALHRARPVDEVLLPRADEVGGGAVAVIAMTAIRISGISAVRRATASEMFRRTCVRQGYTEPVVSNQKMTSIPRPSTAPLPVLTRELAGTFSNASFRFTRISGTCSEGFKALCKAAPLADILDFRSSTFILD